MSETDPYEDDDYDPEAEEKIRTIMAPLTVTKAQTVTKRPGRKKGESDEELAEKEDRLAWETALPKTADEAKFIGHLGNRFLRGISNAQIKKMTIKERVNSASTLFTMRQLLLDKPTVNYSFEERQTVQAVLAKAQKELERRERERATIDITPKEGEHEVT